MARQGMTSNSYFPPSGAEIDGVWADEVHDLYHKVGEVPDRLTVRCNMVLKGVSDDELPKHLEKFKAAFDLYSLRGCPIIAQFTQELFEPAGARPNADFDQLSPYPTNPYIRGFAERAKRVSDFLSQNTGASEYILWNEPNGPVMPLDAQHFAALLNHCWKTMTSAFHIYWGGILLSHVELTGVDHPHEAAYINNVYQWLATNRLAGPGIDRWPWDAINLHIHHERSTTADPDPTAPPQPGYLVKARNMIEQIVRTRWQDTALVIVGEWGVSIEEFQPESTKASNPLTRAYRGLNDILRPDVMLYFAHPYVDERHLGGAQWGLRDGTDKTMLFEPYRNVLKT